jgi:mono/diheme cytochrome c family protein
MSPASRLSLLALAAALASGAVSAQSAPDVQRGRQLYDTYCGGCHYERVHDRSRENSSVHSLEDLRAEVTRWAGETRQRYTREDIEDIVAYLNRSHYHLER